MSDAAPRDGWLPPGFVHPTRVDLLPDVHLRPIRGDDVDIDYLDAFVPGWLTDAWPFTRPRFDS